MTYPLAPSQTILLTYCINIYHQRILPTRKYRRPNSLPVHITTYHVAGFDDEDEIVVRPAHPPMPQVQTTVGQERRSLRQNFQSISGQRGGGDGKSSSKSVHRGGGFYGSVRNLLGTNGGSLGSVGQNLNRLAEPSSPNPELPSVRLRRRYQLLVVDDSGLNRKLLCKALRAAGHSCEEAADGSIAVSKVGRYSGWIHRQ